MEMAIGALTPGTRILRGFLGLALALGSTAASAQQVNLRGRIVEKSLRKPVPGAVVRLAGDPSLSYLTGPDGRFQITKVPNRLKASRLAPGPDAAADSRDALGRAPLHGFAAWARRFGLPGNPYATSSGPSDLRAAAKGSAPAAFPAAALEISRTGLASKTVETAETVKDLGDIVLDYPERKVGVGTPPPYGSFHVFDGARATLDAEWEHWMGTYRTKNNLGPTPITWTMVEDPVDPGMTMRTCCRVQWGDEDLVTKRKFRDFQAHVEFNLVSAPRTGTAPGPANSGVYLQSLYEVQIKDDYGVSPLGNHDAGAILNEFAAPENLGKPRGQWQAYDITFRAARFKDGVRTEKARLTMFWNGKKVHTNRETANEHNVGVSSDPLTDAPHGFKLQSEGHDVRFRNVWIKELDIVTPDTDFGY